MEQTAFFVIGIALVLVALGVTAVGLRHERFPSAGVMRLGLALFAILVAATLVAAVVNARDEQSERREAANREASTEAEASEAEVEASEAPEATGEAAEPAPGGSPEQIALGEEVFSSAGCGGCHTLQAAASTGEIGPDLDQALAAQDPAFIRESIVDPDAVIAEGFGAGTMPQGFGDQLGKNEVDGLVAFLAEATGSDN
jgi:hypothetical protein